MKKLLLVCILVALIAPAQVYASSVSRSFSSAEPECGGLVTVTLDIDVYGTETYCLIDEQYPTAFTITDFSGNGKTQETGHIKWMIGQLTSNDPIEDTQETYELEVASSSGTYVFTGQYSCEGMVDAEGRPVTAQIAGDSSITLDCQDSDNDSVPDSRDECSNTPVSTADPRYRPNATDFDDVTDVEGRNLRNINFSIGKRNKGRINFAQEVDLAPVNDTGCIQRLNLNQYIYIRQNLIGMDSDNLPSLNMPANLTFFNVSFSHPVVLRNSQNCPRNICFQNRTVVNGENLTAFVTRFSNYSLGEAPVCPQGEITSICLCGSLTFDSGYCCSGSWKSSNCGGGSNGGNGGGGNGGGNGGGGDGDDDDDATYEECPAENNTKLCGTDEGVCSVGRSACIKTDDGLRWSECIGSIDPYTEICNDMDDDCDGVVDGTGENMLDCECLVNDTRPCGSNVGLCVEGIQICTDGKWGECLQRQGPFEEICGDGLDNDCDGDIDEDLCVNVSSVICSDGAIPNIGCVCGGSTRTKGFCYDGEYSEISRTPEFPYLVLAIIGILIVLVFTIIVIYREFLSKNKEVTWDELKTKYFTYFYRGVGFLFQNPKTSTPVRRKRKKRYIS